MGKGFNNYMCKKFFHPASRDNLKRVWMAEQQAEAYKKKQEELRTQYEKEQNLHDNKALLSKESKDKLSVNFMYELPAGLRREHEQQHELSAEQDVKFEWQRKFNAPRESYCKDDTEIRDQPFGIQVRNVRCIKCHKWGHINTDKECGMYSVSMSEARKMHAANGAIDVANPAALHEEMRNDGLRMKNSAMELQQISQNNQRHAFVDSDGEPEDAGQALAHEADMGETSFIKTLTREQKMDLLRKMELIERKQKELRRAERRALKEKKKKKKEKKLDEKSMTATKKKKKRDSKSKDKKEKRGKEAASRSPSPVRKLPQDDAAERKDSRRERHVDERRGRRSPSREPRSRREDRPANGKATSRSSRSRGKCRDKSPTEKHPERKRDASSASSSSSSSSSSASDANSSHSSPERPQPTQKDKIPEKRSDKRSDSPAKGRRSRSRSPGHRKRLASPARKSRRSRSGSRKQERSGTPARKQERSGTPARKQERSGTPGRKQERSGTPARLSRSKTPVQRRRRSRSATPARKSRRSRSRSPTQRKRRTRSRSPVQRTRRSRSRSPARKPRRSRSGSAERKSRRSRSQSRERRHRQR